MVKRYGAGWLLSLVRKIATQGVPSPWLTSSRVRSSKRCAVPSLMAVLLCAPAAITSPKAAKASALSVCVCRMRGNTGNAGTTGTSGKRIDEPLRQSNQRLVAATRADDGKAERGTVELHQRHGNLRATRQTGQAQHADGLVAIVVECLFRVTQ